MADEGELFGVGEVPPRTYAEYYRQNTAFDGDYTEVLAPYSIGVAQEEWLDGEELGRIVLSAAM